jgi:GTP-binding protein
VKAPRIKEAEFETGAANSRGFPGWALPEIAFAGRSNVGKSSVIDTLMGGRCPVRISRTPGRTREINFFRVVLAGDVEFAVTDLPGYGYAKVPIWMRKDWGRLVSAYIDGRDQLKAVVLVVDVRRGPEEEEHNIARWLEERDIPLLAVMTKSDKLSKNKLKPAAWKAGKALGKTAGPPVIFSAKTRMGVDDLWKQLLKHI